MSNEVTNGRPFTDFLGDLGIVGDLTTLQNEVVRAVNETRKPGKIKFEIEYKPTGRQTVTARASFDAKIPEHDRPDTTFFSTPDGTLLRDNPDQQKLPLRAVEDYDQETGELRPAPTG